MMFLHRRPAFVVPLHWTVRPGLEECVMDAGVEEARVAEAGGDDGDDKG